MVAQHHTKNTQFCHLKQEAGSGLEVVLNCFDAFPTFHLTNVLANHQPLPLIRKSAHIDVI